MLWCCCWCKPDACWIKGLDVGMLLTGTTHQELISVLSVWFQWQWLVTSLCYTSCYIHAGPVIWDGTFYCCLLDMDNTRCYINAQWTLLTYISFLPHGCFKVSVWQSRLPATLWVCLPCLSGRTESRADEWLTSFYLFNHELKDWKTVVELSQTEIN